MLYIHNYQIIKNPRPGLYDNLRRMDFLGLSSTQNRREVHMFHSTRKVRKTWKCSCWEKGNKCYLGL